jgi:hypothetical protein
VAEVDGGSTDTIRIGEIGTHTEGSLDTEAICIEGGAFIGATAVFTEASFSDGHTDGVITAEAGAEGTATIGVGVTAFEAEARACAGRERGADVLAVTGIARLSPTRL